MNLKELSKKYEHYETPDWAAQAILKKEILTHRVIDPCTGTGVLLRAAGNAGYTVRPLDIFDWGHVFLFPDDNGFDFLGNYAPEEILWADGGEFSVFMNPPFSKACEFVEKSFELGARKVVCFQRMAWWESQGRKDFWEKNPPCRVYICGSRANCWRHDIPKDQRTSTTPTAHAWFVWERGHTGTQLSHIWRDE